MIMTGGSPLSKKRLKRMEEVSACYENIAKHKSGCFLGLDEVRAKQSSGKLKSQDVIDN